jgi:rod shape determining protein RodA
MSERRSRSIFEFDILLIMAVITLIVIGVMFIYSSGVTSTGVVFSNEYLKQIIWAITGIVLMLALAITNYQDLKDWVVYIYLGILVLLVITLMAGKVVNGSRRWLGIGRYGIQPSEFAKIAYILVAARFLETVGPEIRKLQTLSTGVLIAVPAMVLIAIQPDFSTSMIFVPVFMFMAFIAGARTRYIGFVVLCAGFLALFTILPAYEEFILKRSIPFVAILRETHLSTGLLVALGIVIGTSLVALIMTKRNQYYWILYSVSSLFLGVLGSLVLRGYLRGYQVMRLVVFIDPSIDPRGAGWNTIQSITAVGSGGVWGKGFLRGTQSHFQYLPQQSTDFIFSIIAEEWGFIGSAVVFGLFLVIFFRAAMIMSYARDAFGAYLAAGISGLFFTHFAINIGMTIGLLPITGIPLFFLSYGGSPLWSGLVAVGLLLSVYNRKHR